VTEAHTLMGAVQGHHFRNTSHVQKMTELSL